MPARIHGVGTFGKRTRTYRVWTCMRNRCNNPRTPDYKYVPGAVSQSALAAKFGVTQGLISQILRRAVWA